MAHLVPNTNQPLLHCLLLRACGNHGSNNAPDIPAHTQAPFNNNSSTTTTIVLSLMVMKCLSVIPASPALTPNRIIKPTVPTRITV